MLSPQNIEALKAFHAKLQGEREKPRPQGRYLYVNGGVVIHRAGTSKPVRVLFKRAMLLDRSIYTGAILREWRSINGSGKGLVRLAEKTNKASHV